MDANARGDRHSFVSTRWLQFLLNTLVNLLWLFDVGGRRFCTPVCMGLRCCGFTGDALPVVAWGRELAASASARARLLAASFRLQCIGPRTPRAAVRSPRSLLSQRGEDEPAFPRALLADRESLRRSMLLGLGFGGLTLRPAHRIRISSPSASLFRARRWAFAIAASARRVISSVRAASFANCSPA